MRSAVLAAVVLVLISGPVVAEDRDSALTDEDRADLAFFCSLGLPDVAGTPYVEVAIGRGWVDDEDVEHVMTVRGFLLAEEEGAFRVLAGDLFVRRYVPTGPDTPVLKRVGYTELDLGSEVTELIAVTRGRLEAGEKDPLRAVRDSGANWITERLSVRSRLLALAWACREHGLEEEAHQLLEIARRASDSRDGGGDKPALRDGSHDELARTVIWRAVEAFGDASITRPQLLAAFQRFLAAFSESRHAETAQEAVDLLTQMVAEDEAYARAGKPFAEMTKDEQIEDLIFRLRDQNGQQIAGPGSPYIFHHMDRPDDEDTPAHQLVAMGYDAVPQLIEALTDTRFTRTVGFWRSFRYSHYVVRVGDAALSILSGIANRGFWSGTYTAASMVKDGEQSETQERAREWWAEFQEKGERQYFIDAVVCGDGNSSHAARVLIKKYPDDALDAIVKGLENSGEQKSRFWLVQLLCHSMPGEAQAPALLREMKEGPIFDARRAAALWLVRHGYPEAIEVMAMEWSAVDSLAPWDSMSISSFANLFIYAGTDSAIRHLTQGFEKRPHHVRVQVLKDLNARSPRSEKWPPLSPEAFAMIEDFLVGQLMDESEAGFSSSSGTRSVDDLRLADLAADRLADFWGDAQAFDCYALLTDRDRQIHDLKNRWREKRGQDPIPDPNATPMPRLPEDEARTLIEAWQSAPTPEARVRAEALIMEQGLAILPAVRAAAEIEDGESLGYLARQLAFVVREVRVRPAGRALGAQIQTRLHALKGAPLTSEGLLRLLEVVPSELIEGTHAIRVTAQRFGNDRGAEVTVEIVPVPTGREIRENSWKVSTHIKAGRLTLLNQSSLMEALPGSDAWQSMHEPMDRALSVAPGTAVRIRVSVSRSLTSPWPSPIPPERVEEDVRRLLGEEDEGEQTDGD